MGKNLTAAILLGVAAVFILVTVLSHGWWSFDKGGFEAGIGLTSGKACYKGKCETKDIKVENAKEHATFIIIGKAMYYFGFVAVALLLASAIATFLRSAVATSMGRAAIALGGLMLVLCIVYIALKPDKVFDKFDMGWAAFGFMFANICAIAGGILATGVGQAAAFAGVADPYGQNAGANPYGYAQPPAAAPPAPAPSTACRTCPGQARFIPEYQRYFCDACQTYV